MTIVTCTSCKAETEEGKLAISSTAYTPVNVQIPFSMMCIKCPKCDHVIASVLLESLPLSDLSKLMRAAVRNELGKLKMYTLKQ